ncbi:MAG TPA: UDP-2,3-diacylglucosamine diphosphatase LpxI [Xanthobacteraceae bacterium]|nr:UDP-2,3-diacylglucosamine diphosphatase LpxI [Xanthobacteraceae bacterium]
MDEPASSGEVPLTAARDRSPLAIICGAGTLPLAVADAALRHGRPVYLLAITGWTDPHKVTSYPHAWVALGQAGRLWRLARAAGCREVVCVGALSRPPFWKIRLDWATVRLLPRLRRLFRGGDDHLLSGLGRLFEEQGFRIVGAHEVAPEILVAEGPMGRHQPAARDFTDAARGFALIEAMGPFDTGQAVVVADSRVLAVEAAEGTDEMLARVAELRRRGRVHLSGMGVLVKAPKPGQDRRLDLPSIGPATVEAVKNAGLAGIIVRAGEVMVAEAEKLSAAADAAGIFVFGVAAATDGAR